MYPCVPRSASLPGPKRIVVTVPMNWHIGEHDAAHLNRIDLNDRLLDDFTFHTVPDECQVMMALAV